MIGKTVRHTARAVLALATVVLILLSGATPATAAASLSCGEPGNTYGWVTSPVHGASVGSRHCRPMVLGSLSGEYAYWFKAPTTGQWIPTSNNKPYLGGAPGSAGRAHAEAVWALGERYDVRIHFTRYVGYSDRQGWMRRDGSYGFHGVYYPSPQRPGGGLIEISNGGVDLALADKVRGTKPMREVILNVARHEIAHRLIELECGTWQPPIVGTRVEQVTDVYARLYVGKTNTHYPYTASDGAKARAIARGNCG